MSTPRAARAVGGRAWDGPHRLITTRRYASLPNIMKAKKKPLEKTKLSDYALELKQRLQTVRVEEPPPRKGGGKVEDVGGLISRLKELGAL